MTSTRFFGQHGIRVNAPQFSLHLFQVFLVGATVGMTRTVLPSLATEDFHLPSASFLALATFVVVFGLVKAFLNLWAGALSDRHGRHRVLVWGWLAALPIPLLVFFADAWWQIILATVFLGINQGLAWSMALNSKLDLAKPEQRGLVNGLNEFAGYVGVALAGAVAAWAGHIWGIRLGLFVFSLMVIGAGLLSALLFARDTRPWALAQPAAAADPVALGSAAGFWALTWRQPALLALHQAGLVEKFTDAMVWIFFPVFFLAHGLSLAVVGSLVAVYGLTWGLGQLLTGYASDYFGRRALIVTGMVFCGLGVLAVPYLPSVAWWIAALVVIGFGMAMLYPTLGAAVADQSPTAVRATVLGVYRFWRDLGYAVGGLLIGLAAQWSGALWLPFWLVSLAMLGSALWVALAVHVPTRSTRV